MFLKDPDNRSSQAQTTAWEEMKAKERENKADRDNKSNSALDGDRLALYLHSCGQKNYRSEPHGSASIGKKPPPSFSKMDEEIN